MIRRNPWQSLWATLWVVVVAARAQAPSSVYLEDLTSPELRAQVQAGKTVVLIPIGGTEQNGPAMTLGKHNERARVLAGKIARELGNALVAPVIAYVPEGTIEPPSGHMRFAGTISIPDDAFERTLESAARSLRVHGFRHVVLLGDHGGYQRDLHQAAENINHQWAGSGAHVQALTEYYRAATEGFAVLLRERGFRDDEIGTHAALADTSLMLAIDPGAVRTEVLKGREPLGPEQGVLGGDPHRASAQLGELGVDLIVSRSVTAIRAEVARDH
ncbi:MAG: creatininase family protein [Burkholderiaceae bacterium]|nr:creatininase family protein [Burkholderiaceae bacterium]